jgi:hypothetical protein
MKAGIEILSARAGDVFDRDFIGAGEIIVRREGHSRARHVFTINGRTIARLRWRGMRRAVYETEGSSCDIRVGALDRSITLISSDGGESSLHPLSPGNPRREDLRVEMAEGDNFCLYRSIDSRLRSADAFIVHKEFYNSTLLVFRFDNRRRTQTTVRVEVNPTMKWEARFTHRLLALVVCRIILERRHSGLQPVRLKEQPGRLASNPRVCKRGRARQ